MNAGGAYKGERERERSSEGAQTARMERARNGREDTHDARDERPGGRGAVPPFHARGSAQVTRASRYAMRAASACDERNG